MNKQERSLQIENLAKEKGWKFSKTSVISAMDKFEFQTGEKRQIEQIENVIEHEKFKVFDVYWKNEFQMSDAFGPLQHQDSTAKNARQQTIFLFESDTLRLGKFYIYPVNSNNWLNNWIDKAFLQTNFSNHPEFEKRWIARGAIKHLSDENVIDFYEKSDDFWTFATDNLLFIYQMNALIEPARISDWIERIFTLARLLERKI